MEKNDVQSDSANCEATHLMTSQHNFTEILSIYEIIIIYKFLDFEDQLRLSSVNSILKNIFKYHILKQKYTRLQVYKDTPYYVITNEKCDDWVYLNRKEYQEFLRTCADDVRELTIQNPDNKVETIVHDVDLNYFQNLLSFKYNQFIIPVDDVKVIAKRNANLQELTLIGDSIEYETDDELIKCILLKMLNLKRLRIEVVLKLEIKLSQFQAILSKSKLENLNLKAVILWQETTKESEKALTMPSGLNKFALITRFDPDRWPSDITSYFRNFKSLTALTICLAHWVTDEILETFAETCSSLKEMRFERCTFNKVNLFRVPFSVMEFTLFQCTGVSYENLEQILRIYNIKKFYSMRTQYTGIENFYIAPLIESFHITDDLPTLRFESVYAANKNLKELTWYDDSLTNITPSFPLNHCINLHTLNLMGCQMNLATLLELKSLRKLEMPYLIPLVQWPFITQLLQQHSSLRELIIREYKSNDGEYPMMDLPAPYEGFPTQVCRLEIPFEMLVLALDFWIDLFARNNSLMLICWTREEYLRVGETIKVIVNHRQFPKTMKTIDICGFHTDCNLIRNHYEEFLERLEIQTKHSIFKFMYDMDGYWYNLDGLGYHKHYYYNRITLYRK